MCELTDSMEVFTQNGRRRIPGTCNVDRIHGGCLDSDYSTQYIIEEEDSEGKTYTTGVMNAPLNDQSFYSYTRFIGGRWRHITRPVESCIYTTSKPQYIVHFPDEAGGGTNTQVVGYGRCLNASHFPAGDCPGNMSLAGGEMEGMPVVCKLEVSQAEYLFGRKGGNCQGSAFGGCDACDVGFPFKLYGSSSGYQNIARGEYFFQCLNERPRDEDVVCRKINPHKFIVESEIHEEFVCHHITGNIYIYIYIYLLDQKIASKTIRIMNEDGSFKNNRWAPRAASECPTSMQMDLAFGGLTVIICEARINETVDNLYDPQKHCITEDGSGSPCIECEEGFLAVAGRKGTEGSLSDIRVDKCIPDDQKPEGVPFERFDGGPWEDFAIVLGIIYIYIYI